MSLNSLSAPAESPRRGGGLVSPRDAIALGAILLVCLIAGSAFDFAISNALYDPANPLAFAIEAYGEFPVTALASVAGVSLARAALVGRGCSGGHSARYSGGRAGGTGTAGRSGSVGRAGLAGVTPGAVALCVTGLAMFMGADAYMTYEAMQALDAPTALIALVNLLLLGLVNFVVWRVTPDAERGALVRYALIALFVLAVDAAFVFGLKEVWERPRMRLIQSVWGVAGGGSVDFQPWWQMGCDLRGQLVAMGAPNDGFRSFPSGHASNSACALALLAALPLLNPALARFRSQLFWCGAAVCAVVSWGRIVIGAHFLSDVTFGFAITYAAFLAGSWLVLRRDRRTKEPISAPAPAPTPMPTPVPTPEAQVPTPSAPR